MDALGALVDGAAAEAALRALAEQYRAWIELRRVDVAALRGTRRETAEELLRLAGLAAERIERGVVALAEDPVALDAFRVANRSVARALRKRLALDEPRWHAFQLAMRDDLKTEPALDALGMAISKRRAAPGLVHHSDRGSQYTSLALGKTRQHAGALPSMGRRGDAYDNAPTWNGFVYLAFILDCYSRMIVGWQLATHLRTELVIDAPWMANGLRQPQSGLIAHTDRGSQGAFPTIRRTSLEPYR